MAAIQTISITKNAVRRVAELIKNEGAENLMLRVQVSAGGCSGFEYGFDLDKIKNEDDEVFTSDGVNIVIDQTSLELLKGSEIDYVDDLAGASFRLNIPNATASCGCGISFSM